MTKYDQLRFNLIKDLVSEYMLCCDNMSNSEEMAESLVFTISEIFLDPDIARTREQYLFSNAIEFEEDIDPHEDTDDKIIDVPFIEVVKVAAWPTETDLIGDEV